MKVSYPSDATAFLDRAGAFMLADDPLNNMVYGIAARLRDGHRFGADTPF